MTSLPLAFLLEIVKRLSLEERITHFAPVCRYFYAVIHDSSFRQTINTINPNPLDFGPTEKTVIQLLGLVPSIIVSQENANIEEMSEVYKSDFSSPHTVDIEYDLQHFSMGDG